MSLDHNTRVPRPSVTSVPEYQLSGLPFCKTELATQSATFTFPRVTRWFVIKSTQEAKIFFKNGNVAENQFFTLPANTVSPRFELRCAKLYATTTQNANIEVIAGLTHILAEQSVPEDMLDWIE